MKNPLQIVVGGFSRVLLRDLFAGRALGGILTTMHGTIDAHEVAASAYRVADAMLAQRGNRRAAEPRA